MKPVRPLISISVAALAALCLSAAVQAQSGPIKIGVLAPVTGPLATPGKEMVEGWKVFWDQAGHTAGGRSVEYVIADTTCNPDQALTQARRVVHQEKVHFMVGPLCGHEGPAVAQVSKETGVPLVMDAAGADVITKWERISSVVRTAVSAVVVGPDRVRLFEAWFDFGMDKKKKIYGGYWMHQDVLPQMDDRGIGLIGNSLNYAAGLQTPENIAFTTEFAKRTNRLPSRFGESAYSAGLWTKTAIDSINGKVEDREAFLKAMRTVSVQGPRGPLRMDDFGNPIRNVYISKIEKIDHPVLGEVLTNVPFKTYEGVSQFWTYEPKDFLARGPYKR